MCKKIIQPNFKKKVSGGINADSNNPAFNTDSNNMENLMAKLCTLQGKDIKISR